jgi:histone deacetylase complex subunit SAP18
VESSADVMASETINRNATTPFLLRLFYKTGRHNSADDFHPIGPNPPHVEIYTWLSATIDELSHLIADNLPQLLPDPAIGTRLDFELVYPDIRTPPQNDGYGSYQKKTLGSVVLGAGGPGVTNGEDNTGGRRGSYATGDGDKTLADAMFVIGDCIDCAIYPPLPNGDIAASSRSLGGRAGPPPLRENGYGPPAFTGRRGGGGDGVPPGEWRRGDPVPANTGGFGRRGGRGRGW